MKYQPDCEPVIHGTALIGWFLALVRELDAIAHEVYAELKRLNHGGEYREHRIVGSRHLQTQAFKAALAQRYHEHNRCC